MKTHWLVGLFLASSALILIGGCTPGDQAGTKPVSAQESLQHVPNRAPDKPGMPPPGVPGGPAGPGGMGRGYPGAPGGYPGGPPGGYPR